MELLNNFIILFVILSLFLFIYGLIYLTTYINNIENKVLYATSIQNLCKKNAYESETIRYILYMLLKDTSQKDTLQSTYRSLVGSSLAISILIIILNMIGSIISTLEIDALSETSVVTLLKLIFPVSSVILIIFIILSSVGLYLVNNTLNTLYSTTSVYSNYLNTLKKLLFTTDNLNKVRTNTIINQNNPLLEIIDSIKHRILYTSKTSTIQKYDDAVHQYNSYITAKDFDSLIGYVDFSENTDDYILVESSICGISLCNEGVGQLIKGLSSENFTTFLTFLHESPFPTPTNGVFYTVWLRDLIVNINNAGLGADLSRELSLLTEDSPIWTLLRNIQTQDDIHGCECDGNPLNLKTEDKIELLTTLNNMKSQKNGDPTIDITKTISKFKNYYIISFCIISYIIFHIMYTLFDKKWVIIIYFTLLLLITISYSYISRYMYSNDE